MLKAKRPIRATTGERGFTLILAAISAVVMLGMLGSAYDVGKMFIVKNELQTYCDAAALAAVAQLNGTSGGVVAANTSASTGPLGSTTPNLYNFDSAAISNVTATYATDFSGGYVSYAAASGVSPNSYRFVKVVATASVPLSFLPVLPGISSSIPVSASATGGQMAQSAVSNGGLEPFLPDAHSPTNTTGNFGFVSGAEYTLKWGNGSTSCAGDQGWTDPNNASQHGFVNLGQGNGNSSLTDVITYGGYPNANSTPSVIDARTALSPGTDLDSVPGNRGTTIFGALSARAALDTDDTSTTYAQYVAGGKGNGERVVIAPIGDPTSISGQGSNTTEQVIGFGAFFLDPSYSGTSGSICATYIGPASMNGASAGGTDSSKIYSNALYQ